MILITGSSGLVGSHLLYYYAEKGEKIRALIRDHKKKDSVLRTFSYYSPSSEKLLDNIDWYIGDVTDPSSLEEALIGIDYVYHTAAFVSFNHRNKKKIFDTNVRGTANIVNLCLEKEIKKLCYVSSIAALGQNENGAPVTEDILWKPSKKVSAYSLSKYHSEMEVWRGITEGLNAVIVNPSVILGPGDWSKGSPAFFEFASKGLKYYTNGANGFVDVRDVVQGMVKAMESNITSERFTLSSDNLSYFDFFSLLSSSLGNKPPYKKANNLILLVAQKFESMRSFIFNTEPKLTRDTINISKKTTGYSNSKSIEILGIKYKPIKESVFEIGSLYLSEKTIQRLH
jgi:nucleoside-diphosphate-sugar epimerase